jgi:hypothetical protein
MLERYYPEAQTTEEGTSFPGIPADTAITKESV